MWHHQSFLLSMTCRHNDMSMTALGLSHLLMASHWFCPLHSTLPTLRTVTWSSMFVTTQRSITTRKFIHITRGRYINFRSPTSFIAIVCSLISTIVSMSWINIVTKILSHFCGRLIICIVHARACFTSCRAIHDGVFQSDAIRCGCEGKHVVVLLYKLKMAREIIICNKINELLQGNILRRGLLLYMLLVSHQSAKCGRFGNVSPQGKQFVQNGTHIDPGKEVYRFNNKFLLIFSKCELP